MLASAIYQGRVRHRRFEPKQHAFDYAVFMVYLDLQELDQVFAQSRWWSLERWNIASFKQHDYLHGQKKPDRSLYERVADLVEAEGGHRPTGPIRMLTNLRYWGFIINPITCYYCFDQHERLETIVAEVTNTPWRQRCHYLLDVSQDPETPSKTHKHPSVRFQKMMHVSPFQPMDLDYHWHGNSPDKRLNIHIDVQRQQRSVFDATLSLERQALSASSMRRILLQHPWMTAKVCAAIYWQALKLAYKRIPFFGNPNTKTPANNTQ